MGLLDKYLEDRFHVLPDGRTVFMPKGPRGPIYLVPDAATRKRFEGLVKFGGVVTTLLLFSAAKLAYQDRRVDLGWAALLLFIPVWTWWVARYAGERLQEVHDASMFEPPSLEHAEYKDVFLWARATGAVAVIIIGLILSTQAAAAWARWGLLAAAFLAALTLPFTINDLQRKRELDKREHERSDGWFHDSAYTPRRRLF